MNKTLIKLLAAVTIVFLGVFIVLPSTTTSDYINRLILAVVIGAIIGYVTEL